MKNFKNSAIALLIVTAISSTAGASICQAYSTAWARTVGCAGKGTGKGSTLSGSKLLEANKTAGSSFGAVALNSSGATLSCSIIDSVADGLSVGMLGGTCNQGVKFAVQANY